MLVSGSTIHTDASLSAFRARGGVHGADFFVAFATLSHGVFSAPVGGANGMLEWAHSVVSRATSGLAEHLSKGAWFRHFDLYVIRGLFV